ncbi:flagellar basal body rod protein FlgC [candidate division GN15 bacterium]|nr:flagellar basal body rod protein FlgC [candidate division GN15 bacterium]
MGGILNAIEVSSQGLSAQRARMNTIAQNIAHAETTETADGGPYRRKQVVFSEDKQRGSFGSVLKRAHGKLARTDDSHISSGRRIGRTKTEMSSVEHERSEDRDTQFKLVYDPNHPKADEEGYVQMPNVEIINEMVDMMTASRAYEANTSVISAAKNMAKDALEI